MSVRKWMFAGALLLAVGLSSLGFAQEPELKLNPDKKSKIVQFTDSHVEWRDPRSDIAFERMNQVLDDEKSDLVVSTRDIIYSKPALENMRNVLKTVSDRKIPFSTVFGNHDNEQGATKEESLKVVESLLYSLTVDGAPGISGTGNHALTVRSFDGKKDAFVLYCIDSNIYSTIKGVKGYDYIKRDQIDWYCKKSAEFTRNNGREPVSSLAFSHITLPELNQAASDENARLYGTRREKACAPVLNSGLFTAIKRNRDAMGVFVGHDHDDDYAARWYDVLLVYGRFTGGPTEYIHIPNGTRVIELNEGARTFKTQIRTKAGIEQLTIYPDSFVKE